MSIDEYCKRAQEILQEYEQRDGWMIDFQTGLLDCVDDGRILFTDLMDKLDAFHAAIWPTVEK